MKYKHVIQVSISILIITIGVVVTAYAGSQCLVSQPMVLAAITK